MKPTEDYFDVGNCISMTGLLVLLQTGRNIIGEIYKHFKISKVAILSLHKIKHCFQKHSVINDLTDGTYHWYHGIDVRCSVRNDSPAITTAKYDELVFH
jgi:hypothetical protein